MEAVTIAPYNKSLFHIQPQQSHPRVSVGRVIHVRFCRWLDKASPEAIRKTAIRCITFLAFWLAYIAPQFLLGFLTAVLKWDSFRLPLFCIVLYSTLNA